MRSGAGQAVVLGIGVLIAAIGGAVVRADEGVDRAVELPEVKLKVATDATLPPLAPRQNPLALTPPTAIPHPPPPPLDEGPRGDEAVGRPVSGGRRLAVPAAETVATQLVMMEWSRWVGIAPWSHVTADSVERNLNGRWVLDRDGFYVNQFGHPYQGTFPFTAARSAGLGFWGSAPFTVGASLLWEVAGETTAPSLNDQVTTTVSGIVLGEMLYRFAGALYGEGGAFNEALAFLLAPWGAVNHRVLGTAQVVHAPPSRWQLAAGGATYTGPGPSGGGTPLPWGGLSILYGVPGREGLELDDPFDHFSLETSWTASEQPAATVLARGVLAGTTFDADVAAGLYGLYLSFDLDTPPGHRISTTALGFGGSARRDLGRGLALEGDAIASAVLLGAAGAVDRGPDGQGRDYRFGPGQQALLAVRLLAGKRASAGLSLRQYLLFASDGEPGSELLLHGAATASIRLVGPAGVGVELARYLRRAEIGPATVSQADTAVRVYLVVGGGA
jgi:Domain of unknown function (DUF3943)